MYIPFTGQSAKEDVRVYRVIEHGRFCTRRLRVRQLISSLVVVQYREKPGCIYTWCVLETGLNSHTFSCCALLCSRLCDLKQAFC